MGRASSKSTKKRLRQAKKSQEVNKANRTRVKSQVKKLRMAVGRGEDTDKLLAQTYSVIDKSVRKGVLKKAAASRHKSRLTKLARSVD